MEQFQHILFPAAFGAFMQEAGYWWQLRFNLDADKYDAVLRSGRYWTVVIMMILGSAVGTYYWVGENATSPRDCMVFGAAFPLILKHAIGAAASGRRRLGSAPAKPDVLMTYFRMS